MRTYKHILSLIFALFPLLSIAESRSVTLQVGETKILQIPSAVTIQSGFQVTSSWLTTNNNGVVEIVDYDYGGDWVKIKVNKYTDRTVYLSCYYKSDNIPSALFEFNISIDAPILSLSADPCGGPVKKGTKVNLTCNVGNVADQYANETKIYYRLDGYNPDTGSSLYNNSGITIDKSCTLKAFASWGGFNSEIITEKYTVDELYVSASPSGGVVKDGTIIYLTCAVSGADIYYTIDGSLPSKYSTKYTSSGIRIDRDCTLKAIAYKDGKSSEIMIEEYTIKVDPTAINVYLSGETVIVGESINALYSLTPSNATASITWASDDSSVAKIDRSSGRITGVKVGTTTIRGRTDNGLEGSCTVVVSTLGVKLVSAGVNHTLFTKEDGALWVIGNRANNLPNKWVDRASIVSIAAGNDNVKFVTSQGELYGSGSDEYGQLGTVAHETSRQFWKIMDGVKSVTGNLSTFIITSDDNLYVCGRNDYGNLGTGNTSEQNKPVFIMGNVSYVASGDNHTLIIKNDGSLWACGYNKYGQLGDGSTTDQKKPIKIMDGVAFASVGYLHSLILKKDGTLLACGYNKYGQLCDGTTNSSGSPFEVMRDVVFVEASDFSSFVVKKDGSLWVCGSSYEGILGIGSTNTQFELTKLMDEVKSVSSSGLNTFFVKNDGSLWACGRNDNGQLGDGTKTNRWTPVEIVQGKSAPSKEPTDISVSPSSETIKVGDTFTISYTLSPSNAETAVTWTSDDSSIATVSSSGMVTGKKAGSTYINATTSNGKTDYCEVIVEEDSPSPSGSIEINATNFPDPNFRKVLLELEEGMDGYFTNEELKGILFLELSESGITDFKGLEFFTSLYLFMSHGNSFSSIDLSKNTELKEFHCYDNELLSEVDISNNPKLEFFNCQNCNLNSLDTSNNPELRIVWIGYSLVTSLDFSKNQNLEELQCNCNKLTSLDVSNCTVLETLYCYENQITSLSIANNVALKKLYCHRNLIKDTNMDNLIRNLPVNYSDTESEFYVIDEVDGEGNVCTPTQVSAIKAKGWTPYYYDTTQYEWMEYTGNESTGIKVALDDKKQNIPIFDLFGKRLNNPRKGIYIMGGKKVVVK